MPPAYRHHRPSSSAPKTSTPPSPSMRSYYDVLGVSAQATSDEIKEAYKNKLFAAHPDKSSQSSDNSEVTTLKQAYAILRDAVSRKQYDAEFKHDLKVKGFDVTADGLDVYLLEDFTEDEVDGEYVWFLDCPRCTGHRSMSLTETDLDECGTADGSGGFMIVVQCSTCSLWIKVTYAVADD